LTLNIQFLSHPLLVFLLMILSFSHTLFRCFFPNRGFTSFAAACSLARFFPCLSLCFPVGPRALGLTLLIVEGLYLFFPTLLVLSLLPRRPRGGNSLHVASFGTWKSPCTRPLASQISRTVPIFFSPESPSPSCRIGSRFLFLQRPF